MTVARIPFTSIDRYAARHGINGEDFDVFRQMIRAMDEVAMDHWRGEQQPGKQNVAQREMSPELFDAVFG